MHDRKHGYGIFRGQMVEDMKDSGRMVFNMAQAYT